MDALVEVRGIQKYFPIREGVLGTAHGWIRAVDGVDLRVRAGGETFGLAGESGCGKSTLGRAILRLIEPTAGQVFFEGKDILAFRGEKLRLLRRNMQMVFQDPYSALNPRLTVRDIVAEPLVTHLRLTRKEVDLRAAALLEEVGLDGSYLSRYPHEFSGGQRQRVVIARALALNPKFIVLDEPTSALDVSVQAQILNLLVSLRERLGLSYLLISHDLSVVEHMSHRVAVMYLGRIVEQGPAEEILHRPLHPYAKALLAAVPVPDPDHQGREIVLEGGVPSPANPPPGCRFHPRCEQRVPACACSEPVLASVGGEHYVACHLMVSSVATQSA